MTPTSKLGQVFRTVDGLAAAGANKSETDAAAADIFTILSDANVRDAEAYEALVEAVCEENGWVSPGDQYKARREAAVRRREAAQRQVTDLLERVGDDRPALYLVRSVAVDRNSAVVQSARPRRTTKPAKPKRVPERVYAYIVEFRHAFFNDLDVAGMKTFDDLRKALDDNYTGKHLPPRARSDRHGSLIRDVGAVYANLPTQQRAPFENELVRLVATYLPLARQQQGAESA